MPLRIRAGSIVIEPATYPAMMRTCAATSCTALSAVIAHRADSMPLCRTGGRILRDHAEKHARREEKDRGEQFEFFHTAHDGPHADPLASIKC